MDILNKPINSFSFNDVVAFCQEGHREGIQIDYKRDLPQDGLAKHFAAFSNTRGGVIIVGVEEDRQTGVPTSWNGIPNNAQVVERIHQWASNVDPIPRYEVHATDVSNGNVFILIRVFEGDRTPYYVQNDARVYVRTGNITPSIDLASPEMLELLFGKKEKTKLARNIYIKRSEEIYQAGLRRAERERLKAIAEEKEEYRRKKQQWEADGDPVRPYTSRYYKRVLGSEAAMLTILIQPFYPREQLMSPQEIKGRIIEIRDGDGTFRLEFPSLNPEPIQDGVMTFEWGEGNGEIRNEQIYSTGLMRLSFDILRVDENKNKLVYVAHIALLMFELLKAAGNYYKVAGYQGGLRGHLLIDGLEGVTLNRGITARSHFPYEDKIALMPEYRLNLDMDTSILNDNKSFQDYFIQLVKEIYWSLGCGEIKDDALVAYLKERHWHVE